MASAPPVSIVLPVHNGERFLREAIDSCLVQTYTDFELVIVDDASDDETPSIVRGYAERDARVRVIRNDSNRGLAASLNVGFAAACGRYFTWTSDDNRYRPNALNTLVAALDRRPDVDVVYSDYTTIDAGGNPLEQRRAVPVEALARINCVGASFLYRRAVHERIGGFDQRRDLVEDYDFWLRASTRFRFAPLAVDLYEYRLHDRSLSTQRDDAIVRAHRDLLRDALPQMTWVGRPAQARACVHLARTTLSHGDAAAALQDLWLGVRVSPAAVAADCARRLTVGVRRRFASAA